MPAVTVAQLRQNPTEAINAAAEGISTDVTKHGQVVARLVPPSRPRWRLFAEVQHLFVDGDAAWAREVEEERNRDRLDPDD